MKVYFFRHGLAGDRETWEGDDSLRPLTSKGKAQVKSAARRMVKLELKLDAILTSPLTRALQTAEIAAEKFDMKVIQDDRLSPGFSERELAAILNEHSSAEAIMVVGHEPDFSETISTVTGGSELVMKKGGLARVDIDNVADVEGRLVWLIPPKILSD